MRPETDNDGAVRADVWLWRARFFRTRGLAASFVRSDGLRVTQGDLTRRVSKPSTTLAAGDIVTFGKGADIVSVEVLAAGTRRGPAGEAQSLYRRVEILNE